MTKSEFAAATVTALRRATAEPHQLAAPAPTLEELNIDISQCSPEEIISIELIVRETWNAPSKSNVGS